MRRLAAVLLALVLAPLPVQAELADTVDRVKPSIVAVGTWQKTRTPPFRFLGTGFAVGDGSRIATNAHVVPENLDADKLETLVVLTGIGNTQPKIREVRRVANSPEHDLALLQMPGPPLPPLALRSPQDVREGQSYAFTGFPIGAALGFFPVTHRAMVAAITPIAQPLPHASQLKERVVRRLGRGSFPVFQLDATAYPGSSGSPLYDMERGEVVGILNMVFVKGTKETVLSQPSGISYAIPVRHLVELLGGDGR